MLGSMVILLIGMASHDHPPMTANDTQRVVLTELPQHYPWGIPASCQHDSIYTCSQHRVDELETSRHIGHFSSFTVKDMPTDAIAHSKGLCKLSFSVAITGELLCSHSGTLCYGRRRYV